MLQMITAGIDNAARRNRCRLSVLLLLLTLSDQQRVTQMINQFIVKLSALCNLNCSYCYIYHKADSTWKVRPKLMTDEIFGATLDRVKRYCDSAGQRSVMILFHGGEPTLVGAKRFNAMCRSARQKLGDTAAVALGIQTNGTLLDPEWMDIFSKQDVQVGISLDGPKDINDVFRINHAGAGSYDSVHRGIELLKSEGIAFAILSVVQLGENPLRIHRHFINLGCQEVSYLLPAYTHDSIEPIRKQFGPTPCADFLIPIFDEWWFNGTIDVRVREFWNIARVIMGGESQLDSIGNPPLPFLSIETDGSIEGLDKLRICEDGMTSIGLNVQSSDFTEIGQLNTMHALAMSGLPLPTNCTSCPEMHTCAGGYLPHRYSRARQFDNPSVWCADLLRLFTHIRERMGVSYNETAARRHSLRLLHSHSSCLITRAARHLSSTMMNEVTPHIQDDKLNLADIHPAPARQL